MGVPDGILFECEQEIPRTRPLGSVVLEVLAFTKLLLPKDLNDAGMSGEVFSVVSQLLNVLFTPVWIEFSPEIFQGFLYHSVAKKRNFFPQDSQTKDFQAERGDGLMESCTCRRCRFHRAGPPPPPWTPVTLT